MSRSKASSGRRRSQREWRALVKEWRKGGCSIEEFCRRRSLSAATFRWWRWRLSSRDRVEQSDSSSSWVAVDLAAPARATDAGFGFLVEGYYATSPP